MISLDVALKGLADTRERLHNAAALGSPTILSEQMMRMAQYAAILDEHLAELEKEYDITLSAKILEYIHEGYKVSPAETQAKIYMAEIKGQISYLTRLSGSAWRQTGIIQSRINHLKTESQTNL